jgi:hypothetical protein
VAENYTSGHGWSARWPTLDFVNKQILFPGGKRRTTATLAINRDGDVFQFLIDGEDMGTLRAADYGGFDRVLFDVFHKKIEPVKLTVQ